MTLALGMTINEAKAISVRIREDAEAAWTLVLEAHERLAHKALGYSTWGAYCDAELLITRRKAHELESKARVAQVLGRGGDTSHMRDMSRREVRMIGAKLDEVERDIEQGATPDEAIIHALASNDMPLRRKGSGAMSRQRRAVLDMKPREVIVLPHAGYACNSTGSCSMSSMIGKIKQSENNPRRRYLMQHTKRGQYVVACYDPLDIVNLNY